MLPNKPGLVIDARQHWNLCLRTDQLAHCTKPALSLSVSLSLYLDSKPTRSLSRHKTDLRSCWKTIQIDGSSATGRIRWQGGLAARRCGQWSSAISASTDSATRPADSRGGCRAVMVAMCCFLNLDIYQWSSNVHTPRRQNNTYIHTCIHTNMHTYKHAYIQTCIHTNMHTYMYIAIYIYVCVCVYRDMIIFHNAKHMGSVSELIDYDRT